MNPARKARRGLPAGPWWAAAFAARLRQSLVGLALGAGLAAASATEAARPADAQGYPPVLQALVESAIDNPQQTLAEVRARLKQPAQAQPPAQRFWLWLAAARLEFALEFDAEVAESLRAARRAYEAAGSAPDMRAWLELLELRLRSVSDPGTATLQALMDARRRHAVPAHTILDCEWTEAELWLLGQMGSLDEAWRASEELERCGQITGWTYFRAQALSERAAVARAAVNMGLAAAGRASLVDGERVAHLFEQAFAAAGPGPARYHRSLIAFSAGGTLIALQRPMEAARHLQRALETSRSLDDRAGIAAALTTQASLDVQQGHHARALVALADAEPLLRAMSVGSQTRLTQLYTTRLRAKLALQQTDTLPQTIAAALSLHEQGVQALTRQELARALAAAQAALGRHALAYDLMLRAHELGERARSEASGAQVLRLQTLYENSRRDAELAALRHAEEAGRLSLQAQQATARMLWAALLASSVLVAGAGVVGWRQWARRQQLAHLALRDALTGLANRRAIEAYARAQLEQAQRLKLPFVLALIDLDHFKDINDRHGHATGDAVLRSFASAVPALLRAPDRMGRWGGEEFLLVLPGTTQAELPGVFARLRLAFSATEVPGLRSPHGRTFSMGAAEAGADGSGLEALIEAADRRLYAAKAAGRDRLGT